MATILFLTVMTNSCNTICYIRHQLDLGRFSKSKYITAIKITTLFFFLLFCGYRSYKSAGLTPVPLRDKLRPLPIFPLQPGKGISHHSVYLSSREAASVSPPSSLSPSFFSLSLSFSPPPRSSLRPSLFARRHIYMPIFLPIFSKINK